MIAENVQEDILRPKLVAGAVIINKEGGIFLIRSPKWKDELTIPGGHVEWSEKIEDALKREIMEETGLKVENPRLLDAFEFINSAAYKDGQKHIVSLNYLVDLSEDSGDVQLDGREGMEYFWLTPEEILASEEIDESIKKDVGIYLERYKKDGKHKWFGKKCADCEKYKAEADEFKSGWQRALADYKNLQNEITARRSEWVQMSERQILDEFIPVYENFKTAFYHHPELDENDEKHKNFKNWVDGIGYIMKQFAEIFKQHNIEEIKTVGEKFDPNLHEAVGEEEIKEKEAGMILREVSGGYTMGGKVIKPAKVVVSK
jgi:molecular chaperone GrpE (heat shock protein)